MKAFFFVLVVLFSQQTSYAEIIAIDRIAIRKMPIDKKNFSLRNFSSILQIPADGLTILLGSGYDYITGEIIPNSCVIPTKGKPDVSVGTQKLVISDSYEYVNTVATMASKQSSSGSGGGFSFAYKLVSLGADVSDSSSEYFNNFDSFARIYLRYITQSVERFDGAWGVGYKGEAQAVDKSRFLAHCGTHYVSKIFKGSVYDKTYRFSLKETKRSAENKRSASIGIGEIFSANGETASSEKSVSELTTMQIVGTTKGVPVPIESTEPPEDPTTPSALSKAVRFARSGYADLVLNSNPDNAQLLFVEVLPYRRLPAPGADTIPSVPLSLMAKLQGKLGTYDTLLSEILTMQLVASFSPEVYSKFYSGSVADIPALQTQADNLRIEYFKAVEKCQKAISTFHTTLPPNAEKLCSEGLDILSREKVAAVSLKPVASPPLPPSP